MASDHSAPSPPQPEEFADPSHGIRLHRRTRIAAVCLAVLLLGFLITVVVPASLRPRIFTPLAALSGLDWASLTAVVILVRLAAPFLADRTRRRRYWRRLSREPAGLLALGGTTGFVLVGVVGPLVTPPDPVVRPAASYQPPIGFTVAAEVSYSCVGDLVAGRCQGTSRFPLGTTFAGHDVATLLVAGGRVALRIALVTAAVVVPLGVIIGTVAGVHGGRVDALLTGITDAVSLIPPLVAYVILVFVLARGGGNFLLLIATFGSLGWAGIARAVRESVLSRRSEPYVAAARSASASRWWVLRQHVLPNVADTVVATAAQQIAALVLAEAGLSYLGYGVASATSWGGLVAAGTKGTLFAELMATWWVSLFPAIALAGTVVSLSIFGDSLRTVLDPERDGT